MDRKHKNYHKPGRKRITFNDTDSESDDDCTNYKRRRVGTTKSSNFNRESAIRRPLKSHGFSYKDLSDLLKKPPDDVIMELSTKNTSLSDFVGKQSFQPDELALLVQLLGQKLSILDSNVKFMQIGLLTQVVGHQFLKELVSFTAQLDGSGIPLPGGSKNVDRIQCSSIQLFHDLFAFCNCICIKMPALAKERLQPYIRTLKLCFVNLKDSFVTTTFENLLSKITDLEQQILQTSLKDECNKTEESAKKMYWKGKRELSAGEIELLYLHPPPENFRTISIAPTTLELTGGEIPFLRPNIKTGKYPNADVYLDVQFRLLREDFVAPLRTAIQDILNPRHSDKRNRTVRSYKDVKIVDVKFSGESSVYTLRFGSSKNVRWESSKRLLPGSLLCLTPDNFKSIFLASVVNRQIEDLRNGLVHVILESVNRPDMKNVVNYLMLECDQVYYESYRHTLKALQHLNLDEWPLKNYFLGETVKSIPAPKYLISMPEKQPTSPNYSPMPIDNIDESCDLNEMDSGVYSRDITHETPKSETLDQEKINQCPKGIEYVSLQKIKWPNKTLDREFCQILLEETSRAPGLRVGKLTRTKPRKNQGKSSRPWFCESMESDKNADMDTKEEMISSIMDYDKWPTANELGLDMSQYLAFRGAITQELTIIQGPPGTGKTFIGLQIAKFIYKNPGIYKKMQGMNCPFSNQGFNIFLPYLNNSCPILVVCYTNHALDQFMEGIVKAIEDDGCKNPKQVVIRIGGRSKSPKLQDFSIQARVQEARKYRTFDSSYAVARNKLYAQFKGLQFKRDQLLSELSGLNNIDGILDFSNLSLSAERLENVFPSNLRNLICEDDWDDDDSFFHEGLLSWLELETFWSEQKLRQFETNYFQTHSISDRMQFRIQQESLSQEKNNEDYEDENFDMEDLMAHRFEICYEMENQQNRLEHELPYWLSIRQIEDQIEIGNDYMTSVKNLKNQRKYLHRIMNAYNERRINLNIKDASFIVDQSRSEEFLLTKQLTIKEKWAIYFHVIESMKPAYFDEIGEKEREIIQVQKQLNEINRIGEGLLLQKASFVGMTTTGAAKYSSLLPIMKSPIVIVEEAGEVLESHIVTSLTKHCQHLILIGDHKQLRPKVNVYTLEKDHNMDISLFERLINNGVNHFQLRIQHRMRPNICKLLVPTIYAELENHSSVHNYPPVLGVKKSLFFIHHTEKEKLAGDSSNSKVNEYEAHFLIKFCRYLILQGYSSDQITILTTYKGQMFLLKKFQMKEGNIASGVRVTVVDDYQGEENDIILLSLVRSNEENKIGFLKTDNRICVALSRAKHGMFIIGNMDCLIGSGSQTWRKIKKDLEDQESFGTGLELVCQIHETTTLIENIKDFDTIPEGGCMKMCDTVLNCDHICPLVCHPIDRYHTDLKCHAPCKRNCTRGHSCKEKCYVDCTSLCKVSVEKILPCGHTLRVKCRFYDQQISCSEIVMKRLGCGHEHRTSCYIQEESINCTTNIEVKLSNCEHKLQVKCFQKNSKLKCVSNCDTRLECGHTCGGICHTDEDPDHKAFQCLKECARSCKLGHSCQIKHWCFFKCPPCVIQVEKTLLCGHKTKMQCGKDIRENKCEAIVTTESSDCDHKITTHCSAPSIKAFCTENVVSPVESLCGHKVMIPCKLTNSATPENVLSYCKEPCSAIWKENNEGYCGHGCKGNCSSCYQGRVHQKCNDKCGRNLPCGHSCKFPCSSLCPPCKEKCEFQCKHSRCRRNCGEPCTVCNERCSLSCAHSKCTRRCGQSCNRKPCYHNCTKKLKCGHGCIGLCGEVCPTLCRVCNRDEVVEIFLGYEDRADARFIYLEECGHTIEVKGMDRYMNQSVNTGDILPKRCPKCNCIITMCERYSNIFNSRVEDIIKVKEKIYGNDRRFGTKLNRIIEKLQKPDLFDDFRQYLMQHVCTRREQISHALYKPNRMDQYTFESVDNMTSWWCTAKSNVKGIEGSCNIDLRRKLQIVNPYNNLFEEVKKRALPLSKREILEFGREFGRLTDQMKIHRREMIQELKDIPGAVELVSKAQNHLSLHRYKPYTTTIKTELLEIITELDVQIKEKIKTWEKENTAVVNQEIFKAVGFGVNHWKKCPKGHFYVIGDCGQPNESSHCPECRSAIGAASYHVLASGNSNATLEEINSSGPDTKRIRNLIQDK